MSVTAKALWHIESHLGSELSLEMIARDVGVSRYHLSRAFSTATGCGLALYVRARRLSGAAKALLNGAPDILSVSLDAGYGSHEAFTRAFKQHFGFTPEQVRAQRQTIEIKLLEPIKMKTDYATNIAPIRVAERDAIGIFGLSEHYTPRTIAGIPAQWSRYLPHRPYIKTQVDKIDYGVIYNQDDAGNFDYICGLEVSEFPSHPTEFARLRISPQTYVVFLHADHISSIGATCSAIWNQGLPDSGYQAAESPWFERYTEAFNGRTGLGGVEIWVPIIR